MQNNSAEATFIHLLKSKRLSDSDNRPNGCNNRLNKKHETQRETHKEGKKLAGQENNKLR